MKTLKRDRFGNRAVKSPTIPGKYNDSFFFSFVLRAVIRVNVFYGKMALSP